MRMLLAVVVGITASSALAQQTPRKLTLYKTASSAACSGVQTVWVDPDTKTYYAKGDKLYGKTTHGGYNCRRQADAAGYSASKSR